MNFMVPNYSVYYQAERMIVNYQHPTVLQAFFPSIFLSSMPKHGKEVVKQWGFKALGKESRIVFKLTLKFYAFCILGV